MRLSVVWSVARWVCCVCRPVCLSCLRVGLDVHPKAVRAVLCLEQHQQVRASFPCQQSGVGCLVRAPAAGRARRA